MKKPTKREIVQALKDYRKCIHDSKREFVGTTPSGRMLWVLRDKNALFEVACFDAAIRALSLIVCVAMLTGCRFPGVDQHEGHNYEPNPWHVPVDTNSAKL